ncbi:type II toxin-antitoxin system VapC family toxin [Candidatus Uhrbacteria bacterium]|nr:type II toxin-antitoxin system VapC family toxin [Candidatus Uhrbacteria bacterium]
MRYFLDTSVIMYAAGAEHAYKKPCVLILEKIERNLIDALTSTEVIQEIIYRFAHIGEKQKGIELSRVIMSFVPLVGVDESAIQSALDLFERYDVDARDALHAAVALQFGTNAILSSDKHFDTIEEIERVDPFAFNND